MSNSILLDSVAMSALQASRLISDDLNTTNKRVASSKRIEGAEDNASYWAMSLLLESDSSSLLAVSDAMTLGKSQISIANESVTKIKTYLDTIQKLLTQSYEKDGSVNLKIIQDTIKVNVDGINSAVYSASLVEKNMLTNNGEYVNIVGGYHREGGSANVDLIAVGGPELNFAKKNADGSLDMTTGVLKNVFGTGIPAGAAFDVDNLNYWVDNYKRVRDGFENHEPGFTEEGVAQALKKVTDITEGLTAKDMSEIDFTKVKSSSLEFVLKAVQNNISNTISKVVTAGSKLGTIETRIKGQIDYTANLMDYISEGVGALVDADLNEETVRLQALRTQNELAAEVLAIGNRVSQSVLSIFE